MDPPLVEIVLLVVSVAVAFNLFLTLRLVTIVGAGKLPAPFSVVIGEPLPGFHGKAFSDGRPMNSADLIGQAAVIVFLSSGCHKCLARIPELREINPAMQRAGIPLWIIGVDSTRRVARRLKGSDLLQNYLIVDPPTRRGLNPSNAAPFYIFVDHQGIAQARSFIGDENWQLFVEQLNDDYPSIGVAA
jgi:hypothetical protein